VNRKVRVRLFQYEYDALTDFCFNIGTGGFSTSTALRELNKRHYKRVPAAMMLWNKPPSILGRRCDEVRLFRTGRYTDLVRCPG
jgi:lysozyme